MRARTFLLILLFVTHAAASMAAAADFTVMQKDKNFSEKVIIVKMGDNVTFVNADNVTHNVFSMTKGHEFEVKAQSPGRKDTVPFSKSGNLEIQCAIHPKMKLNVQVAP